MQTFYTHDQIAQFQSDIWKRRALHGRDLPRRRTTDPYEIWISETMLCQTQVSRVIVYYHNWLKQFPTVDILAQATPTDVLSARSGLGYNSRGLRVLQAAKTIFARHSEQSEESSKKKSFDGLGPSLRQGNTKFPNTYEDLIALPGVGDYVANAILAFAYHQDVAVIDTNIRRILIYHFRLDPAIKLPALKDFALMVLPYGYASERYNALMDYGALELTSKRSGIRPLTRQSQFEGSRRQVRAWIVKEILNSKSGILNESIIHKRFSDRDDVQSIIEELVKEGVIEMKNEALRIKH